MVAYSLYILRIEREETSSALEENYHQSQNEGSRLTSGSHVAAHFIIARENNEKHSS